MQDVFAIIDKVADTPSTVLITGESGTGKELVATALHEGSSRRDKPFIKINCAAIPKDLIETELFGYERGAFTGAVTSKPGRFELADGGTLFLDEIGEIPVEMQVKLLRALQESEFERVGGIKTIRVDVRLVAATNRDLAGGDRGRALPRGPLLPAQRRAHRPARRCASGRATSRCSRATSSRSTTAPQQEDRGHRPTTRSPLLQAYAWPGNIRELENVIERVLLFADGPLIAAWPICPSRLRAPARQRRCPARAARRRTAAQPGETGLKDIVRQKRRRAGEGPHHQGARGDGRQRHPRREAPADQPQVAADEDEGVLASRRRRRVSVEAEGQRCQ